MGDCTPARPLPRSPTVGPRRRPTPTSPAGSGSPRSSSPAARLLPADPEMMKGLQREPARAPASGSSASRSIPSTTRPRSSPATPEGRRRPGRWWFLTGPKDDVVPPDPRAVPGRAGRDGPEARQAGGRGGHRTATASPWSTAATTSSATIAHSTTRKPTRRRSCSRGPGGSIAPAWVRRLPAVNATLNGTCAVLLLAGWALILAGKVRPARGVHDPRRSRSRRLFLACYLIYHFQVGSVPFRGRRAGPVPVFHDPALAHAPAPSAWSR